MAFLQVFEKFTKIGPTDNIVKICQTYRMKKIKCFHEISATFSEYH